MSFRPTTLVVLTTGLIAAAGLTGCQVPRSIRSFELRSFPWRRVPQPRPQHEEDRVGSETYLPEAADVPYPVPQQATPQPVTPDQPRLRLPPEPTFPSDPATEIRPIPVPPALEPEGGRFQSAASASHLQHRSDPRRASQHAGSRTGEQFATATVPSRRIGQEPVRHHEA
ncbi:MAG: hypothetical protein FD138_1573 [Planctomycetota bacterium]|nr:MAG: hypothetical protein FD138_1573 [Planctomycetota bacterium]